jgi:hypothetical protein
VLFEQLALNVLKKVLRTPPNAPSDQQAHGVTEPRIGVGFHSSFTD